MDDVLSELDKSRQKKLLAATEGVQTLFTSADFPSAVPCGDVPAAIGDTWDGEHFYRAGERVLTPLEQARKDAEDMAAALELLGVGNNTEVAE